MPADARRLVRRSASSPRDARLAIAPEQLELSDALARALLRRANDEAERADRRAAEDRFDQGALLNEIVQLTRDEARVLDGFVDGPGAARERMQLARATTRLLAGVYGLARCRLGLKLIEHYGLKKFDQLEAIDLPVAGPDGRPARFPATRGILRRALEALGDAR